MANNHIRHNDLKPKILSSLKAKGQTEPFSIAGYHLDQNGTWLRKIANDFRPLEQQGFSGLVGEHIVDYFCGTHDTFEAHEESIIKGMEEALAQLNTSQTTT